LFHCVITIRYTKSHFHFHFHWLNGGDAQRLGTLSVCSADMSAVVKNREEDAERLAEEVSENRDDLNRMLESFRHRERQLLDDVETLQHKNATLSDLVDLVTERAESTQKELDRCRTSSASGDLASADVATPASSTDVKKEWEVRIS